MALVNSGGSQHRVTCAACGGKVKIAAWQLGQSCACPRCGKPLQIPAPPGGSDNRPSPPANRPAKPSLSGAPSKPSTNPARTDPASGKPAAPQQPATDSTDWLDGELQRLKDALANPPQPKPKAKAKPPGKTTASTASTKPTRTGDPTAGDDLPRLSAEGLDRDEYPQASKAAAEDVFEPDDPAPISCQLCGTRYYATVADIGRRKPCPDCYTPNEVKLPKRAPKRRAPPAFDNPAEFDFRLSPEHDLPTYRPLTAGELTEADLRELRAAKKPTPPAGQTTPAQVINLRCPRCKTIVVAPRRLIGQQIACPECRANIPVADDPPAPRTPPSNRPAQPPPVQTDASPRKGPSTAGPRPSAKPPSASGRRPGPPQPPPPTGNLPPPAHMQAMGSDVATSLALPNGIGRSVLTRPSPASLLEHLRLAATVLTHTTGFFCCLFNACLLAVLVAMAQFAIEMLSQGIHAVASLFLMLLILAIWIPWMAFLGSCCVSLVEDTANGSDAFEWPEDWYAEFLPSLGALLVSALGAGLAGWSVSSGFRFLGAPAWFSSLLFTAGFLGAFPVVLLSILESGQAWQPISVVVWRSLQQARQVWARFFMESVILIAPATLSTWALASGSLAWIVCGAAGLSVIMLLYWRLLGLLARDCGEILPVREAPNTTH